MRIRYRTLLIAASKGATQLVTIGSVMALVRLISQEEVGTYRQVMLVIVFLTSILGMNLPASLFYFVPKLGPDHRRPLVYHLMLLTLASAAVTALLVFFGADIIADRFDNPDLAPLLRIASVYPFARLFLSQVPAFFISIDRAGRAGAYTLLSEGFRAGIVVSMAWAGEPLTTIFYWMVAGSLVLAVVGLIDMYRLSPGRGWPSLDRGLIDQVLGYVLPMLAATAVGIINRHLGSLMISVIFDPERYAVYSCGAMQLPAVGIITSSIFTAIMPNLVTLWEEKRKQKVLDLWEVAVRKASLIVFPCFAVFLVCSGDLMLLLWGRGYEDSRWPFMVYLFELPMRVAIYGSLLRAIGRTKPIAVGAVIALVANFATSISLIVLARTFLGPDSLLAFVAPAIGTEMATFASIVYLLRKIGQDMQVSQRELMPWKDLIRIMSLCLLAGLVIYVLPLDSLSLLTRLIVQAVVFLAVLAILLLATGTLHDDEKKILAGPLRWVSRVVKSRKSSDTDRTGKND